MLKPVPMQPPFAARIDQPITHQGLQHIAPAGALPASGKRAAPELIEPKLLPQFAPQPASTPLPRSMKFKLLKVHLYPVSGGMIGNLPIPGKERQSSLLAAILVESFNNSAPPLTLAVIDLAQIQHLALHDLAARTTPILHQTNSDVPCRLSCAACTAKT